MFRDLPRALTPESPVLFGAGQPCSLSLSGAAASPGSHTISAACAMDFKGDETEPRLRNKVGSLCLGLWRKEPCKQLSVNREIVSIPHSPKYEIQPFYVFNIFFNQNYIGDLYKGCCQIFVKASQLHDIIQRFTVCRLLWNESYCLHLHPLGISKLSHFPKRYNGFLRC